MAKYIRRVVSNPAPEIEDLLLREPDFSEIPDDTDLTYRNAADLLGITLPEVKGLVQDGVLKAGRNIDGKPVIRGRDLRKFVEKETEAVEFVSEDEEAEEQTKAAEAPKNGAKSAKPAEVDLEEADEEASITLSIGSLVKFVKAILKGDEEDEEEEEEAEAAPKSKKTNPSYRALKTGKP